MQPASPALEIARQRGIELKQGIAEELPFEAETFDGLLVVSTLCFLQDLPRAFSEFRRVLKENGKLVIGMIPADSAWGKLYEKKGREGHRFYASARFHTTKEIIELAASRGFAVSRTSSCLLNPPEGRQIHAAHEGIIANAGFVCIELLK